LRGCCEVCSTAAAADEDFEVCSAAWVSSWDGAEGTHFVFLPLGFVAALTGFEAALVFFALDLGFVLVVTAVAVSVVAMAAGAEE